MITMTIKSNEYKTFALFHVSILQSYAILVTFKGFPVFEIRKNLDLRKILSTPKIFLKSRFHCTYYKTLLQLSTFGYHCGEGKCMLVLWLHKMFPHETKGWIYWVTQLELGLTTFTIIISYCLIWHFIWSNGKYLREKLYQKEKSKLHKLFSWCAFFSFCL